MGGGGDKYIGGPPIGLKSIDFKVEGGTYPPAPCCIAPNPTGLVVVVVVVELYITWYDTLAIITWSYTLAIVTWSYKLAIVTWSAIH